MTFGGLWPDAQDRTLGALEGMSLETMLLARWCGGLLARPSGLAASGAHDAHTWLFSCSAAPSPHPAAAVRRRRPARAAVHHGLLQYITPSILALMACSSTAKPSPAPAP